MAHSSAAEKSTIERLEEEIKLVEEEMRDRNNHSNITKLENKRRALGSFLQEKAKGVLVKARISMLKDRDAPTSFFFKLERK